jgi:diguanylate cyclase (GGDEF)-like protein
MSRIGFNRNKAKLRALFGIRARLAVLAVILAGPLMFERVRSLEDTRSKQIHAASGDLATLARHAADAQREVISSVQAVLKSSAYIHSAASQVDRGCAILRASLQVDLPWVRSVSVVDTDGIVQCSTVERLVGVSLGDRAYFQRALESHDFVLSDYLFSRGTRKPSVVAAYPVTAIDAERPAVIVAAVNLDWMSEIMANLGGRPGVSAALIDRDGVVLATPPDQTGMIGQSISKLPAFGGHKGSANIAGDWFSNVGSDGRRSVSFAPIRGTEARLALSVDEAVATATVNGEIRTAYLQLALVCLFVLLGALIAAERLIVRPIDVIAAMARRFGQGEWATRSERTRLPAEFVPLARAFNAMAAKLAARERELVASNHRLTVMASIDMLSGLANRRGFQSRLDLEWLSAEQDGQEVALLMIDVDHFKPYNDTYGHPEGDACLSRIGEVLAGIAADCGGFAGRYGGEEFCLLLPNCDAEAAARVGEKLRAAVECLNVPHRSSVFQRVTVSIGVACARPGAVALPDLMEAADAALYEAKHRGRNAVAEHGLKRTEEPVLSMAG